MSLSLDTVYFSNSINSYLNAGLILLGLLIAFSVFQKLIVWRLESLARKTTNDLDDAVIRIAKSINPPFYFFVALYIATRFLQTSDQFEKYLWYVVIFVITYQLAKAINVFISYLVDKYSHLESDTGKGTALPTLGKVAKAIVWLIGILIILQNVGVEITSLIAGLGIGGVAIALAAQNILGDLFASFSIIFDKPFKVGDFIEFDDSIGEVKKIGIKTTRIQSLQGEEIIIGNKEITSKKIHNYGVMKKRRAVFSIGVTYETPKTKLKKIPTLIRKIIKNQSDTKLDRVNLSEFGESSIKFESVYFVESDDYNKFMKIQEDINYEIIDIFEQEGIEMAYPTRVIYTKKLS